ncbi:class I SAM-dependent methyltransferase [Actinocatenispora rupis]|uniref:class I SAM-dependent methyltransferase n=1 Tax=Actinocatenispora rupis TaxID=519421 RepID=UPI0019443DDD|nr:class I SAM-dependent methyltransferase [Actinocatenispora rupis]
MYSDADAAALYDVTNPWDPDRYASDRFYHDLVMAADSVLDVGCGTGGMLRLARESGHAGRLTGIDPYVAALDRARRRTDVEWCVGTAADAAWDGVFELATMTSHAFQFLVGDAELRASLAAVRGSLLPGGRFAFETRHPQARAWLDWNPSRAEDLVDARRRPLRSWYEVESVAGDVVTFTGTTAERDGTVLRVDRTRLRFLSEPALDAYLVAAGFTVDARYGDWGGGPVTAASTEIVTVARRL